MNCFDPDSIELGIFCEQYFDFILLPVFKYKALGGCFIFLHLSTLPRPDFPGSDGAEKKITNILFWVRTLQSFFFMFSFMAHANLATILYLLELDWIIMKGQAQKHLEIKLTNITRRHFCSLPYFFIDHSFNTLFTFSNRNFVSVLTYFDSSWWHATGTQIVRTKITSLDLNFCSGNKSSFHSLAHFCSRKHKKSATRVSCSWKNLSSTCSQVWRIVMIMSYGIW